MLLKRKNVVATENKIKTNMLPFLIILRGNREKLVANSQLSIVLEKFKHWPVFLIAHSTKALSIASASLKMNFVYLSSIQIRKQLVVSEGVQLWTKLEADNGMYL